MYTKRLKIDLDELINKILDDLPSDVFNSNDTIFCDPAMGGGQFLKNIISRLKENGFSEKNIEKRIIGCESTDLRVNYAVNKNDLIGQFMTDDKLDKKNFDVVVQNPPYQSQKESTGDDIWPSFVEKALSLVKQNGIVVNITPSTWLRRQGGDIQLFESLNINGEQLPKVSNKVWNNWIENKIEYARILTNEEAAKHFPNIGSSFSYYILKKTKPENTIIDLHKGDSKVTIDINSPFAPPSDINDLSISIHNKIVNSEKLKWIRTTENRKDNLTRMNALSDNKTSEHKHKVYMGVDLIRYTNKKMKYFDNPKLMIPITGQMKNIFVESNCGVSQDLSFLTFSSIKEAKKKLHEFQTNELIQYIFKAYKLGKHITSHVMIPKDINSVKLTKEEKKYISEYVNE